MYETDNTDDIVDQSGVDEPGITEPGADKPGVDEPGVDEPAVDEPGTDKPEVDEPGTDKPPVDAPGKDKPGSDETATDELTVLDYHPSEGDIEQEIIEGLSQPLKMLPPKYFYDQAGSLLFDEITRLEEYYPTETEISIMNDNLDEIVQLIGPQASLIEFGSGSSDKTGRLLDAMDRPAAYVPVEISMDHLVPAAARIAEEHPHVEVLPICADFTQPFELPKPKVMPLRNIVYFPGSTIGNFYPADALHLLQTMAAIAKRDGGLLIGVDLKKDKAILERAYNDARGVTRKFNLNILARINRDLDGNFDLSGFRHRAVYNEQKGRIEMHLVSLRKQTVDVAGAFFEFKENEYILTECSHKYSIEEFAQMGGAAQFECHKVWTDKDELFSVHFFNCVAPDDGAIGTS